MKILYYSPYPNLNLSAPASYGTHMREMITTFERSGHEILPVIMGRIHLADKESAESTKPRWIDFIKPYFGKRIWQSLKDLKLLAFDKGEPKSWSRR
ncbi:hypothetical protein LQ318_02265 [Aliifodinibius salicampi]|uniref:Uncharacterized protein n=1 Tax=Fodinibius salicampi TaxID=1920655 RepID=A0ABT3PV35_9BACT|nr:hypothetical protein [Fodinibius salicampi]MCW9711717.1 hypothetical protein [Fodinibius salicampi]